MKKMNVEKILNNKNILTEVFNEGGDCRKYIYLKEFINDNICMVYEKYTWKKDDDKLHFQYLSKDKYEFQFIADLENKICYGISEWSFELGEYKHLEFDEIITDIKCILSEKINNYAIKNLNKLAYKEVDVNFDKTNALKYYFEDFNIEDKPFALMLSYHFDFGYHSEIWMIALNYLLDPEETINNIYKGFIDDKIDILLRHLKYNELLFTELKKVYDDKDSVWKLNKIIIQALNTIPDAKTVNITISADEHTMTFKYDRNRLIHDLKSSLNTCEYGKAFDKVEDFIKEYILHDENRRGSVSLEFKYIESISYGKKIIYKR